MKTRNGTKVNPIKRKLSTVNESLDTINVICIYDNIVASVVSFTNNKSGVALAEKYFISRIKEFNSNLTDDELNWCVGDGYYRCKFSPEQMNDIAEKQKDIYVRSYKSVYLAIKTSHQVNLDVVAKS
jgi:hypothetical protein